MAIDARELRNIMGHFATGVTVITTRDTAGKPFGLTANAFTSLSLDPPLVVICVDKKVDCYACFEDSKVFVVNILRETKNISRSASPPKASKNSRALLQPEDWAPRGSKVRWGISSANSSMVTMVEITPSTSARSKTPRRRATTRCSSSRASIKDYRNNRRGNGAWNTE